MHVQHRVLVLSPPVAVVTTAVVPSPAKLHVEATTAGCRVASARGVLMRMTVRLCVILPCVEYNGIQRFRYRRHDRQKLCRHRIRYAIRCTTDHIGG